MFTVLFYSTATHPGKTIDAIAKRNEMLQVSETGLIKKKKEQRLTFFLKRERNHFQYQQKLWGLCGFSIQKENTLR